MNLSRLVIAGLLWAPLAMGAAPQIAPPPPPQAGGPAPLLFVRITGPAGLRATFFQAGAPVRAETAPVSVGVRPGYIYQLELTGFPERPDVPNAPRALYPTLEVRGTVAMASGLNAANYPVPLVFSREEIAQAQDGAFFTKVAYLEDPCVAAPVATQLERPLEIDVPPFRDPFEEARVRGRIVMIVRFGERQATAEEMQQRSIPGTMLFPGDKALAAAAVAPYLPWACWPPFDPILGPRPPTECLHDGGDVGPRAGYGPDGRLHGVGPTDSVAEYSDKCGRHITPSNRVCLFAPRFAFIRTEITPAGFSAVTGVTLAKGVQEQVIAQARVPSVETRQAEQMELLLGRERVSVTQGSEGLINIAQFQGHAVAIGRSKGVTVVGTCQQKAPEAPSCLVLCKSSDKRAAQVGEIVTFQLKYTNVGGQPITDVAVSDSLENRFEYVPGTQRTDREAVFTMQDNEAGSAILRWEFGTSLLPGQTGIITFQVRVR